MPFWSQNCSMKWKVSLKDWYIPLCPANMCVHMQQVSFPSQFSHALNSCIFPHYSCSSEVIFHVAQVTMPRTWCSSSSRHPSCSFTCWSAWHWRKQSALCVQLHEKCKFWYFPQCVVSRLVSRCHYATERKAMADDGGVIVKDWSSVFCIIVSKI